MITLQLPNMRREPRVTDSWIYDTAGNACFYQSGESIYDAKTNEYVLYESGGWLYNAKDGAAAYYRSSNWIYSPDGKAVYYHG
jgi:hypothetical protein